MPTHPTVDKLRQRRCAGMAEAFAEPLDPPEVDAPFEERIGLLGEGPFAGADRNLSSSPEMSLKRRRPNAPANRAPPAS